jgi:DNA-binding transcriptional MerR regulator
MYDPLSDIHHYAENLTISQVVKFFEKKELGITRPMIQNYIRDGLLPPPVNKRFYTHRHLAALVLIDYLKNVFGIGNIKEAIAPFITDDGLDLGVYRALLMNLEIVSVKWRAAVAPAVIKPEIHNRPKSAPPVTLEMDKEAVKNFSTLLLMAHTVDLKALSGMDKS